MNDEKKNKIKDLEAKIQELLDKKNSLGAGAKLERREIDLQVDKIKQQINDMKNGLHEVKDQTNDNQEQ